MNTRRTKFACPVCGYHLCAREDDKIICLRPTCEWNIPAKRKNDSSIPTLTELRKNEGEL
jgi:uncharacterized membrane protein